MTRTMHRRKSALLAVAGAALLAGAAAWSLHAAAVREEATREIPAALSADDVHRVRELIARGADPNTRENPDNPPAPRTLLDRLRWLFHPPRRHGTGTSPLIVATEHQDVRLVRELLARGAEVNVEDLFNTTPLSDSLNDDATKPAFEIVKMLLEYGADANVMWADGDMSPLKAVAYLHDSRFERLLLAHNPDVRQQLRFGDTALSAAVVEGRLELAREELRRGAPPNGIVDRPGTTVLMSAAEHGDLEMARVLLEFGADPNRQAFQSALAAVVASREPRAAANRAALVELLLQHGAKLTPPGYYGASPLELAEQRGEKDVVRLLRAAAARERGHKRAGG